MSLYLGSTKVGSLYLGSSKIGTAYLGSAKVYSSGDPYNPLNLPPYTLRLKFQYGKTPAFRSGSSGVQVSSNPNVWDWTYNNAVWSGGFYGNTTTRGYLLEVLGGNTTGVTDMFQLFMSCSGLTTVAVFDTSSVTTTGAMFYGTAITTAPLYDLSSATTTSSMFSGCSSLTSVPLYNTGSVTNMARMFQGCSRLQTIPLFDTSSATDMSSMFLSCNYVTSGSLALYQQASSQATPPTSHSQCFYNCGSSTTTGSRELAQIPSDWK